MLHRRPVLAGMTVAGAAASHVAFGLGVLRGAADRLRGRGRGR
ncbi:hypothetical protein [Miltoncostaea marina]|nr:hypothetical protein [Miltoncostaea marina]